MLRQRVSIIFPYKSGYSRETHEKTRGVSAPPVFDSEVCRRLCQTLRRVSEPNSGIGDCTSKPVLVVNRDTVEADYYKAFKKLAADEYKLNVDNAADVFVVWAVDTCQMWLSGFERILGANNEPTQILQIPGDLQHIGDLDNFYLQMAELSRYVQKGDAHFAVGDYALEPTDAKYLIDAYGTYPLLFNWFSQEATELWHKLSRPRSEFFAVSTVFLREMLKKKKFAYEQTVAFLIYALSDKEKRWKVKCEPLGKLADYEKSRRFREATDQIERTERVLKVLWRELHEGDEFSVKKYEDLDRRSTAIREAAMVFLKNVLQGPETAAAAGA